MIFLQTTVTVVSFLTGFLVFANGANNNTDGDASFPPFKIVPITSADWSVDRITQETKLLEPSKLVYNQGEFTSFLLTSSVGDIFYANDLIRIVPDTVNDNYYDAPYIYSSTLGSLGVNEGSSEATVSFRALWQTGTYKAVLFLEVSYFVMGVSKTFEVQTNSANVVSSKTEYHQGEYMDFTLTSKVDVPFYGYDFLRIIAADGAENTEEPFVFSNLLLQFGDTGFDTQNVTFRALWSSGMYKAVLFLDGGIVIGVSKTFETLTNSVSIDLSNFYFTLGQLMTVSVRSMSGVPFYNDDWIGVYSENIPESEYGSNYEYYIYLASLISGINATTVSFRVTWSPGRYKAVFFLGGKYIAVGSSSTFRAIPLSSCNSKNFDPVTIPQFGPKVGGTVVQFSNLPVCLDDESVNVICRFFNNDDYDFVSVGYRVSSSKVECISPPMFVAATVNVAYTATMENVSEWLEIPETLEWVNSSTTFSYVFGSVAVYRPDFKSSPVLFSNDSLVLEVDEDFLITEALQSLNTEATSNFTKQDIIFDFRLVAFNASSYTLNNLIEPMELNSNQTNALPFDYFDAHVTTARLALVQAQYVAFVMVKDTKRIGSVGSTTLMLFARENDREGLRNGTLLADFIIQKSICPGSERIPACAPTAQQAMNDPRFWEDTDCAFPDGCEFLHPGAAGCFRTKETAIQARFIVNNTNSTIAQHCCYHESGSLLTDVLAGGGINDCFSPDESFYHYIYHHLYDFWPYLYIMKYDTLFTTQNRSLDFPINGQKKKNNGNKGGGNNNQNNGKFKKLILKAEKFVNKFVDNESYLRRIKGYGKRIAFTNKALKFTPALQGATEVAKGFIKGYDGKSLEGEKQGLLTTSGFLAGNFVKDNPAVTSILLGVLLIGAIVQCFLACGPLIAAGILAFRMISLGLAIIDVLELYFEVIRRFFFGDPHLQTLDGQWYSFNGHGEYVAFCTLLEAVEPIDIQQVIGVCGPSIPRKTPGRNALSVHYRFAPLTNGDVGTVTVGVGIQDPLYKDGLTCITVVQHPSRRIDVYDGSTQLDFSELSRFGGNAQIVLQQGLSIARSVNDSDNALTITVNTPSGIQIEVKEALGVLSAALNIVPTMMEGRSVGLLGYANGNVSDDFVVADGSIFTLDPLWESSKRDMELFNNFGQSWMIRSEEQSLFASLANLEKLSFSHFFHPEYVPSFEAPVITDDSRSAADLACGNITSEVLRDACYFDVAVTGKADVFGEVSKQAVIEEQKSIALTNKLPRFEPGTNQNTSVAVGEKASFDVNVVDDDNDPLKLSILYNHENYFELILNDGRVDTAKLNFLGSPSAGLSICQVAASDGKGTSIVTFKVFTMLPASELPTSPPSLCRRWLQKCSRSNDTGTDECCNRMRCSRFGRCRLSLRD